VEIRQQVPVDAATLTPPTPGGGWPSRAVAHADAVESGLQGPVLPVALAGGLLALLLVAAAGSFWADRRARAARGSADVLREDA
jgi:hypothetical protein